MAEYRLFEEGTIPECTTAEWYEDREHAPHLEQRWHRERLLRAAELVNHSIDHPLYRACDLGAGDGGLLSLLDCQGFGYDLMPSNIEAAKIRGVDVQLRDILADPPDFQDIDCAIATEFLEHLIDPHGFLASIYSRNLVASSPVLETADKHYEFHLWAWDQDGFRNLIEGAGYTILEHEIVYDTQIVLAHLL